MGHDEEAPEAEGPALREDLNILTTRLVEVEREIASFKDQLYCNIPLISFTSVQSAMTLT